MAEKMSGISMFMMLFVAVVLGAIFIGIIADSVSEYDVIATTVNESVVLTSAVGQLATYTGNYLVTTPITVINQSNTRILAAGNYTLYSNGTFALADYTASTTNSGTVKITYTHGNENYVESTSARTFADIAVILFAVGILAVALYYGLRKYFDGELNI